MKKRSQSIQSIIQTLKPSTTSEWYVLFALLFYFSIISIPFCYTVRPHELGMLGYDTAGHLCYPSMMIDTENMLSWNLRHPLFRLLYLPIILINEGLLMSGINITWPLFLAFTIIIMSLSGLFIFKTLKALSLDTTSSILLLLLFCSFAHTIMLGIQVDSFVLSMFFGSIMVLLFTTGVHNKLSDNILFLGITGTTSTNCFKFIFYQLLEERSIKKLMIRFLKSIPLFCILFALTIPNLCTRLIECPRGLLYAIMGDSFSFQGSDISKWKLFFENFLSDPILFHHTTGVIYSHETTNLPAYPSIWCYLPIAGVYLLVLISVILNWRHKIVHLFCCCFGFDLIMHFGIGYGVEEAQLFCGHWLFFIPSVTGILLARLKPAASRLLLAVLAATAVCCCTYNLANYFQAL
mgnify:CR=1 FL=1